MVQHGFGQRLIVGEPAGGTSERVRAVCEVLARAGFSAEASTDIRKDVWYKLWGNMTMNPISAFTGATADRILDDPLVKRFCLDNCGRLTDRADHRCPACASAWTASAATMTWCRGSRSATTPPHNKNRTRGAVAAAAT